MKLNELKYTQGSRTTGKRICRGLGSGLGKNGGSGNKGQKSRSGGGVRPGFEGGQNPIYRRLPKRGFTNLSRVVYATVNVGDLDIFDENTVITAELLYQTRVIGKMQPYGLKVLGGGELTKPLVVKANKFTASAIEKIEKAGGKVEVI